MLVDLATGATVPDNARRDAVAARGLTRRIVVGSPNDPASRHALRWVYLTARLSSMTLVVVTAYQPSHPVLTLNGYAYLDTDTRRQASETMQRAVLQTELGAENAPAAISCVVAEGYATDVLVAAAEDAELLVVGRRASRIRRSIADLRTAQTARARTVHRRSDP